MEDKLLLFLIKEVVSQPLKGKSCKANINIPQKETRLLWRLVYSYITTLMDLY